MPNIIIVGAGKGVSSNLARRLAGLGWSIALLSRNVASLQSLAAEVEKQKRDTTSKIIYKAVDVTDTIQLTETLDWAKSQLGKVNAIVYNAARVGVDYLLTVSPETLEFDFKLAVVGSLVTGQWFTKNADLESEEQHPIIYFTSGPLHLYPDPLLGSLSAVKAASYNVAKNFSQILPQKYGIHVVIPTIGDAVRERGIGGTPDDYKWDPETVVEDLFLPYLSQGREQWSVGNTLTEEPNKLPESLIATA